MKAMRVVWVVALCLACAILLAAGDAAASPTAQPVRGGCGGQIAYDQPIRGVIEQGREWCFEFAGAAGDVITARLTRLDGSLDPYLKLWGADHVLAEDDDGGGDRDSLIADFVLPESGSYALLASGFNAASNGGFELLLTRAAGGPQPTSTRPPTTTPAAPPPCGGRIAYGETASGRLSPGASCFYQFVGAAGEFVTISMAGFDAQLDPYLELVDPGGVVETFDDDGGGNRASLILHQLLKTGTYTIVARAYADRSGGPFQLALYRGFSTPVSPRVPPPCGGDLGYGIQGSDIITSAVLTCTYTFTGSRGDLVTIRMDAISGGLDPVIDLWAPSDRRQPAFSNDDLYGVNSLIWRYSLPESGRYEVRAHAYRNRTTGNFKLLLTQGLFAAGDRVQIVYSGAVNLRRTPGSVSKPAGDVLVEVPSGTVLTVVGGPQSADNLRWWRVEHRPAAGGTITGWMAESRANGQILLAPALRP